MRILCNTLNFPDNESDVSINDTFEEFSLICFQHTASPRISSYVVVVFSNSSHFIE